MENRIRKFEIRPVREMSVSASVAWGMFGGFVLGCALCLLLYIIFHKS